MPNWASGNMSLVLPTKNIDKFLNYANGNSDKHFYRTSFKESEECEHNTHGLSKLNFIVDCAWSAHSCLIDLNEDCITLEEVCHKLKVIRLAANFEERGMMFGEKINYNKDDGMDYESYDLNSEAYVDFDEDEEYIDDEEIKNEIANPEEEENTAESTITLDDLLKGVPV